MLSRSSRLRLSHDDAINACAIVAFSEDLYMHRTLPAGHGLVRQKGILFHVGTYLGSNQVAHISPGGLRIDSVATFAEGQQLMVTGSPVQLDLLHRRLQEAMNQRWLYDPFSLNCEHLANFLQKGVRESPQLQGAVMGLAIAGGIVASNKMHPAASLATALFCAWAGVQLGRPSSASTIRAVHE